MCRGSDGGECYLNGSLDEREDGAWGGACEFEVEERSERWRGIWDAYNELKGSSPAADLAKDSQDDS
jgi:hypothetical protein